MRTLRGNAKAAITKPRLCHILRNNVKNRDSFLILVQTIDGGYSRDYGTVLMSTHNIHFCVELTKCIHLGLSGSNFHFVLCLKNVFKNLFLVFFAFYFGLIGELIGYSWTGVRPSSVVRPSVRRRPQCSNIFFSETAWPIKAKFYVEPPWVGGTKVCSRHLGHMTKMAARPYMVKTLKTSSPEPAGRFSRNLVCTIGDSSPS